MRNATGRPEAIAAGAVKMVGTNMNKIVEALNELLAHPVVYKTCIKRVEKYESC